MNSLVGKMVVFALVASSGMVMASARTSLTTVTDLGLSPPANVNSLLPVVNNDSVANAQVVALLFPPLLHIGTNLKIDWKISIASSVSVSDDRRLFTVHLKKWFWSDGRPLTARDVLFSLQMIREFGARYPNAGMGGMPEIIESARAINDRTVQFTLKRAVNPLWFELNGLSQIIPAPAWLWNRYSIDQIYEQQDLASMVRVVDGPYRLQKFVQGRYITFARNPAYSGPAAPLQSLTFKMYSSASSTFWALKSGDIQAAMIPHYLFAARSMVAHLRSCVSNGGYGFNYITLNYSNPKVQFLNDVKVRQAMAFAINQQQIIRAAFHGLAAPGYNPVPSDPDTYLSPQMRELVANPSLAYDPNKAALLLSQAGWHLGSGGVRYKNGRKLTLEMIVPDMSQTLVYTAELIKADWQAVGIDLHLRIIPFNLELAKLHPRGNWQAAMIVWSYNPDFYPSGDGLFNSAGGSNYGEYSNGKMDRLIQKSTEEKGETALYAYENYAYEQQPVIFLPYPKYLVKYDQEVNQKELSEAFYYVDCKPLNKNKDVEATR